MVRWRPADERLIGASLLPEFTSGNTRLPRPEAPCVAPNRGGSRECLVLASRFSADLGAGGRSASTTDRLNGLMA